MHCIQLRRERTGSGRTGDCKPIHFLSCVTQRQLLGYLAEKGHVTDMNDVDLRIIEQAAATDNVHFNLEERAALIQRLKEFKGHPLPCKGLKHKPRRYNSLKPDVSLNYVVNGA